MYNNSQYPQQGYPPPQQPQQGGYYPTAPVAYPPQPAYPPQQQPNYPPQQYLPQQQGYPVPQQQAYPPPQSYVPQPAVYAAQQPYPYNYHQQPPQAYYANQGRAIFAQATGGAYMAAPSGYVVQQPVMVQQPAYVAYPGVAYGPRMKYKHRKHKGFKGFKWKGWKHKGHKWNSTALWNTQDATMAGTKFQIVSCFALFALLVAPFAWQQTQVERVELPVDRIRALNWNASRFAVPDKHVVRIIALGDDDPTPLSLQTPRVEYVYSKLTLTAAQKLQLLALSMQALDDALLAFLPQVVDDDGAFSVFLLCATDTKTPRSPTLTVGKHRHAWSSACSPQSDESQRQSLTRALQDLTQHHLYPVNGAARTTSHARVAVKYRLQFSLLKENGESSWVWDFARLQQRFLAPVLEKLQSVAQFTVEHQTLHYAHIAKEIHTEDGFHFVHADDLKRFKSTNDFLTSSVLSDREQVLHFMAALPISQHAPLFIKPTSGDDRALASAFEIPSWGVVVVLDPLKLESSATTATELQRMMGLFVTELRTLLGLPSFVERQRAVAQDNSALSLQFLASPRDGVAQWELDVVVRSLLRRHVRASMETLQSIVQLVGDMPQMSVLPRVAQRIAHAVALVERILCVPSDAASTSHATCAAHPDSGAAAALLAIAREAVDEADAAYYDHTMIRQLYFPQEQMLGVFAPLLAPLLLPFFFGWIREFKQLRAKRNLNPRE